MDDAEAVNRAFSQGCDARLAGQPKSANPYSSTTHHSLYHHWRMGWQDLNDWWGKHNRWARRLPFLSEEDEPAEPRRLKHGRWASKDGDATENH